MKPTNPLSSSEKGTIIGIVVIAIVLILMIAYFTHTLSFNLISNTVLILVLLSIIYFTTMIRSKEVTDTERSRVKHLFRYSF